MLAVVRHGGEVLQRGPPVRRLCQRTGRRPPVGRRKRTSRPVRAGGRLVGPAVAVPDRRIRAVGLAGVRHVGTPAGTDAAQGATGGRLSRAGDEQRRQGGQGRDHGVFGCRTKAEVPSKVDDERTGEQRQYPEHCSRRRRTPRPPRPSSRSFTSCRTTHPRHVDRATPSADVSRRGDAGVRPATDALPVRRCLRRSGRPRRPGCPPGCPYASGRPSGSWS